MGGYGSGRPGSGRPETDGLLFLDIRYLRRAGFFRAGRDRSYCDSVAWSRRGEPSGTISVIVPASEAPYPPEILLSYRTKTWSETAWTAVDERVAIETTPCHHGGERPWLRCPRCGGRRAVLFCVGGRFRCRACHGVAYSSTRETVTDRATRRAMVLQKRLGGHNHGTIYDPGAKPKGMHQATYERICDELKELNIRTLRIGLARFGKLEKRLAELEEAPRGAPVRRP